MSLKVYEYVIGKRSLSKVRKEGASKSIQNALMSLEGQVKKIQQNDLRDESEGEHGTFMSKRRKDLEERDYHQPNFCTSFENFAESIFSSLHWMLNFNTSLGRALILPAKPCDRGHKPDKVLGLNGVFSGGKDRHG
jgi:hypothetical protein